MLSFGFGYRHISKALGVSQTTAYCWVHPEYADRQRSVSLAAKRRRTGVCEDCGTATRYSGLPGIGVSRFCISCAQKRRGFEEQEQSRQRFVAAVRRWEREHGEPPRQTDWDRSRLRSRGESVRLRWAMAYPHFSCAHRLFGSWGAAIRAAGFEYVDGRKHPRRGGKTA